MMLIIGPCIGAITGVVAGLLAMIAGRILKVKPV
jgi:thiamine transporter ThiT